LEEGGAFSGKRGLLLPIFTSRRLGMNSSFTGGTWRMEVNVLWSGCA